MTEPARRFPPWIVERQPSASASATAMAALAALSGRRRPMDPKTEAGRARIAEAQRLRWGGYRERVLASGLR
jgi:hypothetical protein